MCCLSRQVRHVNLRSQSITTESDASMPKAVGGRYALQVVRFSQPEKIQCGDGHTFSRSERY